ncbi:AP-1 complex subunit sigma, putative [Plasmodium berghei]|uniref:AP complex subunit sigma n=2 Tax=Plasmodium berghei TaxID=5821 RepID=A0A509AKC5_PLABA|nr:AP-1 complex subunit sigma, putative [Plasmodium berghei ANKA]CXI44312.1 AP-1 complex subunit sigma, putative [Plasmodium berghei]SCM22488.1 AP-1 complex subunit sigma, putative [Plasmodium berghei]SCN25478.1 AP-1 complex subunit sigma, putative [Plasmodium berghei]SCO60440.1 AP-1 complex subunit sigma, putative [Plasmodium berghei]SCO62236.1 AP-1 complex subunit sigma, putative [Plasmodium berghei]|eukprot:XP_034421650.1 AP-1 complex subunit sigma, putative [Plasmodium berghei ANKA]
MIHFVLLISRQGKTRLAKWYMPLSQKEKAKIIREASQITLNRTPKLCNFVEWKEYKLVFKRYASLFFILCIDKSDNELITLEIIHHYVEVLDKYFGNVCELDLIFNFHKAYYLLDEILVSGELQESSKKIILRVVASQDSLMEVNKSNKKLGSII